MDNARHEFLQHLKTFQDICLEAHSHQLSKWNASTLTKILQWASYIEKAMTVFDARQHRKTILEDMRRSKGIYLREHQLDSASKYVLTLVLSSPHLSQHPLEDEFLPPVLQHSGLLMKEELISLILYRAHAHIVHQLIEETPALAQDRVQLPLPLRNSLGLGSTTGYPLDSTLRFEHQTQDQALAARQMFEQLQRCPDAHARHSYFQILKKYLDDTLSSVECVQVMVFVILLMGKSVDLSTSLTFECFVEIVRSHFQTCPLRYWQAHAILLARWSATCPTFRLAYVHQLRDQASVLLALGSHAARKEWIVRCLALYRACPLECQDELFSLLSVQSLLRLIDIR